MTYFASDKIKVFPCAYRGVEYDPEARSMTEYGLTHLYGTPSKSQESFIVSWDNPGAENKGLLKCVIGGYYFEISDAKIADFTDGKTLCIKTAEIPAAQADEDSDAVKTTVLVAWTDNNDSVTTALDVDGEFRGLRVSNSTNGATAWLKLINDDGTINQESKRLTDIIRTGSGIGAIASASTTAGAGATASGDYSIAFGAGAKANGANSIAFGTGANSVTANQIVINTIAGSDDIIKIGNEVYVKTNGDAKIGNLKLSGGMNDANGTLSGMADVSATRNALFGGSITVGQDAYFGGNVKAVGDLSANSISVSSATVNGVISANSATIGSVTVSGAYVNNSITIGTRTTTKNAMVTSSLTVGDQATITKATITGDLTVGEHISGETLTLSGKLIADDITTANGITAKSISINEKASIDENGGLTAESASITGDITAGSVTTNSIFASSAVADALLLSSITVNSTTASKLNIHGDVDANSISVNRAAITDSLNINGIELKKDHIAVGPGSNDVLDINNGVRATSFYATNSISASYINSSSASLSELFAGISAESTTAALEVNSTSITANKQIWANSGITTTAITTDNAYIRGSVTVSGSMQITNDLILSQGNLMLSSTTSNICASSLSAGSITATSAFITNSATASGMWINNSITIDGGNLTLNSTTGSINANRINTNSVNANSISTTGTLTLAAESITTASAISAKSLSVNSIDAGSIGVTGGINAANLSTGNILISSFNGDVINKYTSSSSNVTAEWTQQAEKLKIYIWEYTGTLDTDQSVKLYHGLKIKPIAAFVTMKGPDNGSLSWNDYSASLSVRFTDEHITVYNDDHKANSGFYCMFIAPVPAKSTSE